MSQANLPARPDLSYLKKLAKERLEKLRAESPETQLAEAQLEIAREHGFSSWRKLKEHVDAFNDVGAELVLAVRRGDVSTIARILDRHPQLVNATDDAEARIRPSDTRAMRLIHIAVAENQLEAARLLIERGADINVRNADGRLPLHDCFELGRDAIEKILLDAGAKLDVCAAAVLGRHDVLREILRSDPAQANDLTTHLSPLGWCGYAHQADSARTLCKAGAVVASAPHDFEAWHPTCFVAATEVAKVLLEFGADPNWRHHKTADTPLHLVLNSRVVEDPTPFVKMLLDAGADASLRNSAGQSPLDIALQQSGAQVEQYFPAAPVRSKNLAGVIELLRRL